MAKNLEKEDLMLLVSMLNRFQEDINNDIAGFEKAAKDCADNVGDDTYTKEAVTRLNASLKRLASLNAQVQELSAKIQKLSSML